MFKKRQFRIFFYEAKNMKKAKSQLDAQFKTLSLI